MPPYPRPFRFYFRYLSYLGAPSTEKRVCQKPNLDTWDQFGLNAIVFYVQN